MQKHLEVYGIIKKMIQTVTDSEPFKFRARITGRTTAFINTEDVEIAVP